jgi:hypothetical protein
MNHYIVSIEEVMKVDPIRIHVIHEENQTVQFAVLELQKYLTAITGQEVKIIVKSNFDEREPGLWIGLPSVLPPVQFSGERLEADDSIWIDVEGGNGIISGGNPRGVLFSVYRFLTELGCRWVRPGLDGEYLPNVSLSSKIVKLMESPAHSYRGICIEGSVSLENVTEMIDWMPKVGLNSYFIQLREAYLFFKRWYNHINNPLKSSTEVYSVEAAEACVRKAEIEIKKRGLIYQAVGHGWTCEPFGIPAQTWDKWEQEVDPEISQYFALVNNERKLWDGIPMNTNLCYTNSYARAKMITEITRYAAAHPEVDLLHVWLSDGSNNWCECDSCNKVSPSDIYVRILNELDEALSAENLETRIVFLLYKELLWSPVHEEIKNPKRFVLMFAPIHRSYRKSFKVEGELPESPKFVRNQITLPQTVAGNVAFLTEWQRHFSGEGFDFDYHLMWEHHKDPGNTMIAQILHRDIQHLQDIGLEGIISCQTQRSFFPNGLAMTVMASTLWDKKRSFDAIAENYFNSAYGKDGSLCRRYLQEMSELYFELDLENKAYRQKKGKNDVFQRIYSLFQQFEPVLTRNRIHDCICHSTSWRHLNMHAEIWGELTSALEELYRNNPKQAQTKWEALRLKLWEIEDQYQPVLDVYNFVWVFDGIFSEEQA